MSTVEKPTLYLETTVPSYLLAEPSRDILAAARQDATRRWWNRNHTRFQICISDVVLREASKGDRRAAQKRIEFLEQFPVLAPRPEIRLMVDLYLDQYIVPFGSPEGAAHLAFASGLI